MREIELVQSEPGTWFLLALLKQQYGVGYLIWFVGLLWIRIIEHIIFVTNLKFS